MTTQKINHKSKEKEDTKDIIKKLLAEHIGVEPGDIDEEDTFTEELHMTAADLTDFVGNLEKKGIDVSKIDLTELETVGSLIEALSSEELFI